MERRYANLKALRPIRRDLRNHATAAERALWQMLKGRQLHGRKFRRQRSVGAYVLDFYCPSERLAVEVDGSVHDDPAAGIMMPSGSGLSKLSAFVCSVSPTTTF